MKYSTILLDIDGTLVDSNPAHAEAWSEAAVQYGFDRSAAFFVPLIGMGGEKILPLIAPQLKKTESPGKDISGQRKRFFLAKFVQALSPTRGARQLVETLKSQGVACIAATSGEKDEVTPLLKIAGVDDILDGIVTGDQASQAKPSPDIIVAALRDHRLDPSRTVLLGDTPYDIEAARNAGVDTIAVRTGGWRDEALQGAVAIFTDPAALLERLDEFFELRSPASKEEASFV